MENKLPWWEGLDFRFIRLPVELLDRGLSPAAMVLYGVLLGRLSLSGKNGWRDKEGEVFVCCTNREICRLLHCGHDKATKVLRALEGDVPVVGVLQQAESAFLRQVASHPNVRVVTVTEENRDALRLWLTQRK